MAYWTESHVCFHSITTTLKVKQPDSCELQRAGREWPYHRAPVGCEKDRGLWIAAVDARMRETSRQADFFWAGSLLSDILQNGRMGTANSRSIFLAICGHLDFGQSQGKIRA